MMSFPADVRAHFCPFCSLFSEEQTFFRSDFINSEFNVFVSWLHYVMLCFLSVSWHPQEVSSSKNTAYKLHGHTHDVNLGHLCLLEKSRCDDIKIVFLKCVKPEPLKQSETQWTWREQKEKSGDWTLCHTGVIYSVLEWTKFIRSHISSLNHHSLSSTFLHVTRRPCSVYSALSFQPVGRFTDDDSQLLKALLYSLLL